MADADDIMTLANSLDPEVTFTREACESLTQVPKMFRKMAIKTIIKGAKEKGLTEVDQAFAETFKP